MNLADELMRSGIIARGRGKEVAPLGPWGDENRRIYPQVHYRSGKRTKTDAIKDFCRSKSFVTSAMIAAQFEIHISNASSFMTRLARQGFLLDVGTSRKRNNQGGVNARKWVVA